MPCDPCYTTIEASAKLVISAIFRRFRGLFNPRFVVPGGFRFTVTPPLHDYRGICKMRHIDHFLPFSWVITQALWSREDFDAL